MNLAWYSWKTTFLSVLDKHAPCRTFRTRNKPSPWITANLKRQMHARDKAKKIASRSGSSVDWAAYRRKRNEVNLAVKHAKTNFYQNSISNNINNPKKTWSILNDIMGKKSDNTEICEIVDSSNNTLTDSNEIAAYLNRHFSTIGQNLASKLDQSTVNPKE